ncbi:MAG: hypothetical protein ABJR05_01165 [Balneola sp.]
MWYKNVRAQNILILLISLIGLGGTFYFVNLKTELDKEEIHQIQQLVFSHMFDYITEHPNKDPDYFFISISTSDPSQRLLNNFSGNIPLVAAVSSSEITYGFSSSVFHKTKQNKKGIIVDLDVKTKQANGNVQVLASLYKSRSSLATYEYILNNHDGPYQVISFKGSERTEFLN